MDNKDKSIVKKYDLIRGEFITSWILLENHILMYLTRYFCEQELRIVEFEVFIGKSQDLKSKITAFKKILDIAIPNEEERKYVICIIDRSYKHRNNFAHGIIDYSKDNVIEFYKMGHYNKLNKPIIIGHYILSEHESNKSEMQKLSLILSEHINSI